MKMIVEIGHGWAAAQARCSECEHIFTLVKMRRDPVQNTHCPVCGKQKVWLTETPWVGNMEVRVDD